MEQQLLKISEVAEAAEVSLTTVKYYLREGLIQPERKTSRNMAYYAPETVDRVRLIRRLQSERFYPLAVIRRMLNQGIADPSEAELLQAINRTKQEDDHTPIPLRQAAEEAGLEEAHLRLLAEAGLLTPERQGDALWCRRSDLHLMELVRRRLDAGIPAAQTAKTFAMYDRCLRETSRRDIESLVLEAMLTPSLTTEQAVEIINVSDETLDRFISMRRYALNAAVGVAFVERVELFLRRMERFGRGLVTLLPPDTPWLPELKAALEGRAADHAALACYGELIHLRDKGIAYALSTLNRTGELFSAPEYRKDPVCLSLAKAMSVLAPPELACRFPSPPAFELAQSAAGLLTEIQSEKGDAAP